ncbi:MAG: DUF4343 domain-containing protein [Verrucomicrobiaceae bacterium]|nr:MAG: DUF4343 domain-containing protein [Verrucomicrobiaceae bacterium]
MTTTPPVRWLIDGHLARERHYRGFPNLIDAARSLGYTVHESLYTPRMPDLNVPFESDQCVVAYGSHEFIKQIRGQYKDRFWQPGDYLRTANLSYSATTARFGDLFLNDDFVILPFGEVVRRRPAAWGGAIFLKPDAVSKAFTGFIVTEEKFDEEVNALRQIQRIPDEMMCVVAKPKPIHGEFRYVIADRKRVTGSEYRWDNILDVRTDTLPICDAVADLVCQREWQPDRVYTVDVASTDLDGQRVGRIVEFNSFSCSRLYACDTLKIIDQVSQAAWSEFCGDD